jgi:hypothetical protein
MRHSHDRRLPPFTLERSLSTSTSPLLPTSLLFVPTFSLRSVSYDLHAFERLTTAPSLPYIQEYIPSTPKIFSPIDASHISLTCFKDPSYTPFFGDMRKFSSGYALLSLSPFQMYVYVFHTIYAFQLQILHILESLFLSPLQTVGWSW